MCLVFYFAKATKENPPLCKNFLIIASLFPYICLQIVAKQGTIRQVVIVSGVSLPHTHGLKTSYNRISHF